MAESTHQMNIKLNAVVAVLIFTFLALADLKQAQATSLTYSDGIHVDGYILPGITQATIPNFANDASIDWKSKLKTKKGITTGTASLDASHKGGVFLFNGTSTDSHTIDQGKYTLHADFIYGDGPGEFVPDTARGINTVKITGRLTVPSLSIDLKGTLLTSDLDAWACSADLIGFNTTITGGLICGTVFGCTTHGPLHDGGFDPGSDLKHVPGTAATPFPCRPLSGCSGPVCRD
jgi:hypothetical protein